MVAAERSERMARLGSPRGEAGVTPWIHRVEGRRGVEHVAGPEGLAQGEPCGPVGDLGECPAICVRRLARRREAGGRVPVLARAGGQAQGRGPHTLGDMTEDRPGPPVGPDFEHPRARRWASRSVPIASVGPAASDPAAKHPGDPQQRAGLRVIVEGAGRAGPRRGDAEMLFGHDNVGSAPREIGQGPRHINGCHRVEVDAAPGRVVQDRRLGRRAPAWSMRIRGSPSRFTTEAQRGSPRSSCSSSRV